VETAGCLKCGNIAECRKRKKIECYACGLPCPYAEEKCSCDFATSTGTSRSPFSDIQVRNVLDFQRYGLM
jgi:hypothetical protein